VTLQEQATALLEPDHGTDVAVGQIETWSLAQETRNDGKIVSMMSAVTGALRHAKEAFETGEVAGVKSGIKALDHIIGAFAPGDMIVLAGRPAPASRASRCSSRSTPPGPAMASVSARSR
jgi:replicative DNA helicase